MNTTKLIAALLPLSLLGCASQSSNLRIGTDQTYVSLSGQREAIKNVLEYDSMPAGSKSLGEIDAGRCHRRQGAIEPTEALVKADLKVAAYAQGADGITNITFTKESGLSQNCWYILSGKATMLSVPKP